MSVCRKDFSVNFMMKGSLARIFSYSNIHHLRESSRFTLHRSRLTVVNLYTLHRISSHYICVRFRGTARYYFFVFEPACQVNSPRPCVAQALTFRRRGYRRLYSPLIGRRAVGVSAPPITQVPATLSNI